MPKTRQVDRCQRQLITPSHNHDRTRHTTHSEGPFPGGLALANADSRARGNDIPTGWTRGTLCLNVFSPKKSLLRKQRGSDRQRGRDVLHFGKDILKVTGGSRGPSVAACKCHFAWRMKTEAAARTMPARTCRVTITDLDNVGAVVLGLAALRDTDWVAGIAEGPARVRVTVTSIPIEHTTRCKISRTGWTEGAGVRRRSATAAGFALFSGLPR